MYIQKKYTSVNKTLAQKIMDTRNVQDKHSNTYSCAIVDEMNSYSSDETEIGTWFGKPLYRRTYTDYTIQEQNDGLIQYYIFDTDKNKNIKRGYGTVFVEAHDGSKFTSGIGGSSSLGETSIDTNGSTGGIFVTRIVTTDSLGYSVYGIEVTIEYTKTTD